MNNLMGQTVLDQINEQTYLINSTVSDKYEEGVVDAIVADLSYDRVNVARALINNGVEENGETISIEIAPMVLPLRYLFEYRKLIHPDEEIKDPQVILVLESQNISKSKMKIIQLGNLNEFQVDKKNKIVEIKKAVNDFYIIDEQNKTDED